MCPCWVFMCPYFLPEYNWNADIFLFGAHSWSVIGQGDVGNILGLLHLVTPQTEVEKHTEKSSNFKFKQRTCDFEKTLKKSD